MLKNKNMRGANIVGGACWAAGSCVVVMLVVANTAIAQVVSPLCCEASVIPDPANIRCIKVLTSFPCADCSLPGFYLADETIPCGWRRRFVIFAVPCGRSTGFPDPRCL